MNTARKICLMFGLFGLLCPAIALGQSKATSPVVDVVLSVGGEVERPLKLSAGGSRQTTSPDGAG